MKDQYYFSEETFVKVRNAANRLDYLTKQVNQKCIFIYTSPDDDRQAFVLTLHNGAFTLTQFDSDGTSSVLLENIISLDSIIKNLELNISENE